MSEKSVVFIGGRDAVRRFRLAGIKTTYVLTEENMDEVYERIRDDESLIILSSDAGKMMEGRLGELRKKNIVQVVPPDSGEYTVISDLIKDTVGFELS
ncbi:MAG: V-type ATP synthase subunit F [Candidatus Altiarchaeota archaeon]